MPVSLEALDYFYSEVDWSIHLVVLTFSYQLLFMVISCKSITLQNVFYTFIPPVLIYSFNCAYLYLHRIFCSFNKIPKPGNFRKYLKSLCNFENLLSVQKLFRWWNSFFVTFIVTMFQLIHSTTFFGYITCKETGIFFSRKWRQMKKIWWQIYLAHFHQCLLHRQFHFQ